ncbi:MAG: 5'-methylthioadenosine/adenosylhomocysteine nucleosidase [Clostridia bacterium]
MKKIAIICALNCELQLIKESLKNVKVDNVKGNEFVCGTYADNEIYCAVCSVGKVNAAVKTQMIIDRYNVDIVINTGIAGSLAAEAKHLAVVVSDKLFYHDFDLDLFERFFPNKRYFESDKTLSEQFIKANSNEKDIVVGNIATGDEFVCDSEKKKSIRREYEPIACEMEGAAIAHTAFLNNLPCLVIRCISDLADDNASGTYDEFEVIAAHKVAKMVIKFVEMIK